MPKDEWGNIVSNAEYYGGNSTFHTTKDEWGNIVEKNSEGIERSRDENGDVKYTETK
jgi:hypothetical protein